MRDHPPARIVGRPPLLPEDACELGTRFSIQNKERETRLERSRREADAKARGSPLPVRTPAPPWLLRRQELEGCTFQPKLHAKRPQSAPAQPAVVRGLGRRSSRCG